MTMKYAERYYGCFTGTRARRRIAFLCDKEGPCSYCQSDYSDIVQHKTWAEAEDEAQAARELPTCPALPPGGDCWLECLKRYGHHAAWCREYKPAEDRH